MQCCPGGSIAPLLARAARDAHASLHLRCYQACRRSYSRPRSLDTSEVGRDKAVESIVGWRMGWGGGCVGGEWQGGVWGAACSTN